MITPPNQFTLSENGITYGLHTFKDGVNPTVICQLHSSGEWITIGPPTEKQITHFTTHGTKAIAVIVERKPKSTLIEEDQTLAPVATLENLPTNL